MRKLACSDIHLGKYLKLFSTLYSKEIIPKRNNNQTPCQLPAQYVDSVPILFISTFNVSTASKLNI